MGKTLYLECNSGISGDMTVAALLDLGADEKVLMEALDSIPADGYSVEITRVKKAGVDCCDFNVILDAEHENHDHDMEYLHGEGKVCEEHHHHDHEHHHDHDHHHEHEHHHDHDHDHEHHHDHHTESAHEECCACEEHHHHHDHEHHHDHDHHHGHDHHHHHEHRGLQEVLAILDGTDMTDGARKMAEKIFYIVAEAESKAHACPVEEVHFHEVGAIDSIVDIVAVAVCYDNLGIAETIVPYLCEGTGTVRCQHGILPVPVPATAHVVAAHNLNLQIMPVKGEFVTPTGAAIAAALKTGDTLPSRFTIKGIGFGAGKRTYERPSILRAMLIQDTTVASDAGSRLDEIIKLESNIDDCTGENLGYVMDLLLKAGARDVHYTPVYMKKNRPAYQLNVICDEPHVEALEEIIFRETTTIGIRRQSMQRSILDREIRMVETPFGIARVKTVQLAAGARSYPEFDSVSEIADRAGMSFRDAFRMIEEFATQES